MKRFLGNAALVIASLAVCLVAGEALVRLAGFEMREARFFCFDPVNDRVYCPGARGVHKHVYNTLELVVNADGLLDRERALTPATGTRRIALLGDSFTASEYLPPAEKFAGRWERELSAAGAPVEVINFGVSGTGTWHQLQRYQLKARKYRPTHVLLMFYWGNDILDNAEAAAAGGADPLRGDTAVGWKDKFRVARRNFTRWLWNRSLLYQLVNIAGKNFARREQGEAALEANYRPAAQDAATTAGDAAAKPAIPAQLPAAAPPPAPVPAAPRLADQAMQWGSPSWDLTRRLLLALKAKAAEDGAKFGVVHFGGVVHDGNRAVLAQFNRFLADNGIFGFDLFPYFSSLDRAQMERHVIAGDGHWTREGHAAVAKAALPALREWIAAP